MEEMMSEVTGTIRVLHVDDEPDFADLAATYLEREDSRFNIETASSASEGLDRLTDAEFDCIISDYDMPGQNGIRFLETMRNEYPDLPFILYTGKGSEEIASEAISAGVTDYLQKGSGTDKYTVLANRVKNAVGQYRSARNFEASQKRLSLFIDQSPLGVIEWNEQFECVRLNEMAKEILGYSQGDLSGGSWERIVPDSDKDAVGEVVANLIENEGGYKSINENVTKDGERIICEWHNRVVTDSDGDVVAIFSQFQDVTDRLEREQELQQTTARLEVLFDQSPDMINIHDTNGNILHPNTRFCEQTGYDAAELTGMKIWELDQNIEPDEAAEMWAGMEPGDSRLLEGLYQRRDGSTFPVEVHIRRLSLDGEDRFVVISRDISERKERDEKLRQYQNLVETFSAALPDYLFIYDAEGTYLDVITGWEGEVVMYTPEELVGKTVDEILEPEWAVTVQTAITDAIASKTVRTVEYPVQTENGAYWYEAHIAPIPGGYESEPAVLVAARDITNRRRHERQLRQIQQRTQELMHTDSKTETAQLAVDIAHEVMDAPLCGVHLLSEDAQTLEDTAVVNDVRDEVKSELVYRRAADDPVAAFVWQVFEANESQVIEDISEHKMLAGETSARSAIIHPLSGHGVFIVSSMEAGGFNESQQTLIEIVGTALTTALDRVEREIRLIERDEELTRKNEQLKEFASMVSHDLRNPLNVVEGRLELADEECDSDHLDAAAQALDRGFALIDDLLTLAQQGERIREAQPVELSIVIEQCWESVATTDASLVCNTDRIVQADRSRLTQLLENLFRNAVEHGGENVTVIVGDLNNGFYVRDDGPGIDEEERDQVFESGYSTADKGTGIGLDIVREIAEAHGWGVAVVDGTDGGARFEFTDVNLDQ